MHILLAQFYSRTPAPDYDEMAAALRSWGHRVWVGTPNINGDVEWKDGPRIVSVQRGPAHLTPLVRQIRPFAMAASRVAAIRFVLRVRSFISHSGADIVQVNPPAYAFLFPLLISRRTRFILDVRQIGEVAGGGVMGRLRNWRTRIGLRLNAWLFYDHACFATEAAARRVLGERWPKWATVHRVGQGPGFLNHRWPASVQEDRSSPVRFIYLGTISRVRKLEQILHALRWVLQREKNFAVDFVGPDEAEGFYHRLVGELNLSSIVTVKPPIRYQEVPQMLASYDVALAYVPPVPDWRYQPTLKILEYRALGMPIIATDNEPNREIVQDGVNGILIQDSVESLGNAMLRFVTDRVFLHQCQTNARRMRRGITWSDSAKRYEQVVYRKFLIEGDTLP